MNRVGKNLEEEIMAVIAWIGLGNMGVRMAPHLVQAGHVVRGFDVDAASVERAAEAGVEPAGSVAEAVSGADAVFTMLPAGEQVRAVYGGPGGIWESAPAEALLVDSSTVDLETSLWCHAGAHERGLAFVDAPVSGGTAGAAAGSLTFMLGGEGAAKARAGELVTPMAGQVFDTGDQTKGIATKLANNLMLFISLQACAEGSQLAKALGIDAQQFWEIVSVSSGRSWPQQTWYPVPGVVDGAAANRNFEATFSADLALKDLGLAIEAGENRGVRLPTAQVAYTQLDRLRAEGLGHKDCTLVVKYASPDGEVDGYTPE